MARHVDTSVLGSLDSIRTTAFDKRGQKSPGSSRSAGGMQELEDSRHRPMVDTFTPIPCGDGNNLVKARSSSAARSQLECSDLVNAVEDGR